MESGNHYLNGVLSKIRRVANLIYEQNETEIIINRFNFSIDWKLQK